MSKISEMSDEAHSTIKEYEDVKKEYDEFKRLRRQIGKPPRKFIDPEGVKKDLSGEDFYNLLDELKKKKTS